MRHYVLSDRDRISRISFVRTTQNELQLYRNYNRFIIILYIFEPEQLTTFLTATKSLEIFYNYLYRIPVNTNSNIISIL